MAWSANRALRLVVLVYLPEGVPFVGRAGQLLTDIIVKGMKMRREDVYICNVVKCRPPNNRDPFPGEMEACSKHLDAQIEAIKPKV
ncbi:MAG: hypothetical protein IIB04_03770, partial [Acidobacteria bacterium]|nr:hypothetical protein [Acidobacteriota bacterium]